MLDSGRYPTLDDPPLLDRELATRLGPAREGGNDWVDHHLLAAVHYNAVDILVSEDRVLARKARRLGIEERVLTVEEALSVLFQLSSIRPGLHPTVRDTRADEIDFKDAIFDSLKSDYPGFIQWTEKCANQRRQAWFVPGDGPVIAGVAIVKSEIPAEYELSGNALKLSTLKVADQYGGHRYGELLLRQVLEYAHANSFDWVYVTTKPDNDQIIDFVKDFGFAPLPGLDRNGDIALSKPLSPSILGDDLLSNLEFHIQYGPPRYRTDGVGAFLVPIQPKFHKALFPEAEPQGRLMAEGRPFANAIKKAYLSNSVIRQVRPGDLLYFYRSDDTQGVTGVGVVERTLASSEPAEIARFVGKRTVYTWAEISVMCDSDVLAMLFRHARLLSTAVSLREMLEEGVVRGPPQSIQALNTEAVAWLERRQQE